MTAAERIKQLVAAAPPLTTEQRARLEQLLAPGPTADEQEGGVTTPRRTRQQAAEHDPAAEDAA